MEKTGRKNRERRILIVDDNRDLLRSLESLMKLWGYTACVSATAREAIDLFEKTAPSLVLIDADISGESGLEVINKMKNINEDFTPIVMAGNPAQDFIIRGLKAGASALIAKPFSAHQLKRTINLAVSTSSEPGKTIEEPGMSSNVIERTGEKATASDEEIFRLRKMAAIGELYSGLVHEINQPLTALLLNCQDLSLRLGDENGVDPAGMKSGINEILDQVHLLKKIVKSMRTLSRNKNPDDSETFNLNELVRDTVSCIGNRFGQSGIRIDLRLDGTLTPVSGYPVRLQQVLMNLLTNGRDALSESTNPLRILEVSTGRETDEAGRKLLILRVKDNGPGIPDEIRDRIFEPLFTTKDVDHGTGLGLPISREIVEELGGTITFTTLTGVGTEFVVSLPGDEVWPDEVREAA